MLPCQILLILKAVLQYTFELNVLKSTSGSYIQNMTENIISTLYHTCQLSCILPDSHAKQQVVSQQPCQVTNDEFLSHGGNITP